ncbi:hypothetical protein [Palleronia sp. LCG004]|uniref:hypothetical protein n=1 Tax=Palleronia sp. LCG004 TaxID=3079304 RepID=UPI0029431B9C|nr:hypothetical protein [Palleronia sp. LCG004]WOI55276.1 hypothetical protein RVY76_09460 [Palleronia sp. LCG004]
MIALVTAAPASCMMPEEEPGRVRDVSPAALAALPQGVDPAFLIRDENGCYGVALEASEAPNGPPLRDATGQQVCDT